MNKIYSILFLAAALFTACNKGTDIGRFDSAVVDSGSNQNKFRQITFTFSIVNRSGEYLNTTSIDSIQLTVNGKYWGVFSSEANDTSQLTDQVINDVGFSSTKVTYLVVAPYTLSTTNLQTAGDVVNYLNDRIVLTPGDYVCEITALKFHDLKNQWVALKPQLYTVFSVVANNTSAYVGDIVITMN